MKRRHFLKKIFSLSALSFSVPFGWLRSETLVDNDSVVVDHPMHQTIVSALGEYEKIIKADKVSLYIPSAIKYPESMTVKVSAIERKDIKAIAIIIDNNNEPLVAVSKLFENSNAYLSVRVNLEKNSFVRAIVKTDNGLEEIYALAKLKTVF